MPRKWDKDQLFYDIHEIPYQNIPTIQKACVKFLVTGANGFVGRRLCETFAESGTHVRAARRSDRPAQCAHPNIEFLTVGDIGPETDWSVALKDIAVIIHLAARAHVMSDRAESPLDKYRWINVEGTRRLAESAAKAGIKRFVYVSSIKVNGEVTRDKSFTENDNPAPLDAYGLSKWEAELALQDISSRTGIELTIIRPPLVYGPGVKGNLLKLMQYLDKGYLLPLGNINNKRSLIALDNLVDIIALSATSANSAGQTFLVSDGEDLSTTELVQAIAAPLGKKPHLINVPENLFSFLKRVAPTLGPVIDRLTGSLVIDITKLKTVLNWTPRQNLQDGIEAMAINYLKSSRHEH
jgi:UDP-glucose 4-epimerase